ncbi:MAG: PEP-CTERM sorting domain-containing protein [Phycisphaeraceae bacterium]
MGSMHRKSTYSVIKAGVLGLALVLGWAAASAKADVIYSDDFTIDPGTAGSSGRVGSTVAWTESIRGTTSSTLTSDGTSAVFTHVGAVNSPAAYTLDRVVDTTGYTNITITLTAHQNSAASYEDAVTNSTDLLMIQYSLTGSGIVAGSASAAPILLQDIGVWNGVHDTTGESSSPAGNNSGNPTPTATAALALPVGANNNNLFKIRIEGKNSVDNETYWIDSVVISGTLIPEPASLALVALGGLAILGRRRHGQA